MASTPRRQPTPAGSKATVVGRFELQTELGAGELLTRHLARGAGENGSAKLASVVELAKALASNRTIASAVAGASRALLRVQQENVLGTLEVVERSSGLFVVTEYTEGLTLGELMAMHAKKKEQIPLDVALRVLIDLLRGLHAVHETADAQGRKGTILHGAVGPEAVLVGVDGVARVRDFAVGRAARRYMPKPTLASLVGVSPEELAGQTVDRRADLFAAAALGWQCMTGRPLVAEADANTFASAIGRAEFDPPSKHNVFVPRGCDEAIMRGLERDPERRWATAAEMADALGAAAVVATPGRLGKWLGRVGASHLVEHARQIAAGAAAAGPPEATVPSSPGQGVPATTPAQAPEAPAGAKPSRPPPARPAPVVAAPEVAASGAPDIAPRKPSIVVEDESPTIGMVTRASEGAKNFQAATTQLLRNTPSAAERAKPVTATPKVALNIDGPPARAAEPVVSAGSAQAAARSERLVAPDELPTLQGERSGAELVASGLAATPALLAPELAAAAPPPSHPGPAQSPIVPPIPAAPLSGPAAAAAPPFVEPVTARREAFDDLPTVEAQRGVGDVGDGLETMRPPAVAAAGRSKLGLLVAAVGAVGLVVLGAVLLLGNGEGAPAADADGAPSAATTEQAERAALDTNAAAGSGSDTAAETAASSESSTVAAGDEAASTEPAEPAAHAKSTGGRRTTGTRGAQADPYDEPSTATPAPRPTSAGAKPKPTTKPKSEDDLFSRK